MWQELPYKGEGFVIDRYIDESTVVVIPRITSYNVCYTKLLRTTISEPANKIQSINLETTTASQPMNKANPTVSLNIPSASEIKVEEKKVELNLDKPVVDGGKQEQEVVLSYNFV